MGNEELSNALGWVSLACWIVVYSPQIVENYQLKSGEGLSVMFVVIWLLGDLCNLIGACMAGLQATVILVAIYYSLCDITLLSQIYYYRYFYSAHPITLTPNVVLSTENGEEAPLLVRSPSATSETREKKSKFGSAALRYILAFIFVIATGIVAWLVTRDMKGDGNSSGDRQKDVIEWRSQVIGWTSAVLYLGSRIPQICTFRSFSLLLDLVSGMLRHLQGGEGRREYLLII